MSKINLQIGYDLQSLPKVHGFKFRGVLQNGDLEDCKTEFNGDIFSIKSEITGESMLNFLRGWMQHLPKKLISEGFLYEVKKGVGYETLLNCSFIEDKSGKLDIREVFSIKS